MTIVITGATGQLGRLVVDSLLARGVAPAEIVAGGRRADQLAQFESRGVSAVELDYTKPDTLDAAFAGATQVLLISASDPGQRLTQHSAVVDAARASGVSHLVYTSILHADTTPHVLAPDHKATEQLIANSGLPATILRNGWYTENYAGTIEQARQTGEIVASVGAGRVASASRRDYAEAAAVVLTDAGTRGRSYELAGDSSWNYDELAAAATTLSGMPIAFRDVTPEEHLERLTSSGLDAATAAFVVALDQNTRAGLLDETGGDLRGLLGRPTTPLAEGLAVG
jgi:NAD(P)H dehydrogenase (quinone)